MFAGGVAGSMCSERRFEIYHYGMLVRSNSDSTQRAAAAVSALAELTLVFAKPGFLKTLVRGGQSFEWQRFRIS